MKLAAAPPPDIRDPRSEPRPAVNIRSGALKVMAIIGVVLILQYAQSVVIPIVLGVLISYALNPAVTWLARWYVPRWLSAAVLLLVLVGAGGTLLYTLRGEAAALLEQLPQAARRVRQMLENNPQTTPGPIEQVQRAASELERAASAAAPPSSRSGIQRVRVETPFDIRQFIWWGSMGIVDAAGQLVVILFLTYFLLASGDLYRRKLVKIAGPSFTRKKITVQILTDIDRQIERFLIVHLFTSALVGVATWLALRWIGLEQAAMWGLLAGVFNSIPYLGPVFVTAGTAIIALLQFGSIQMAVIVGGVTLAITSLEGMLLTPALMSRAARMNAVAIFIGLLFWGWVWNVWGLLLAVPMLMVMKAVCDHIDELKPIGELIGE